MLLRRLRGIATTALLWGIAWAVILGSIGALATLILRVRVGPGTAFYQGCLAGLFWGVASGALFASALMLAEQTRGFEGLTRLRGLVWGTVSGLWVPMILGVAFGSNALAMMSAGWPAYVVTAVMGALSGTGMVALASPATRPAIASSLGARALPEADSP
jgi:hypothetical protein